MDTTKVSWKDWKSLIEEVELTLHLGSQQDFVHAEVDMHALDRNNRAGNGAALAWKVRGTHEESRLSSEVSYDGYRKGERDRLL